MKIKTARTILTVLLKNHNKEHDVDFIKTLNKEQIQYIYRLIYKKGESKKIREAIDSKIKDNIQKMQTIKEGISKHIIQYKEEEDNINTNKNIKELELKIKDL